MLTERQQRQIERMLDEIEAALERGEWEFVLQRCDVALAIDPQNADAMAYRETAVRGRSASGADGSTPASPHPAPSAVATIPESFVGGETNGKPPAIGTLYVQKWLLGQNPPRALQVVLREPPAS